MSTAPCHGSEKSPLPGAPSARRSPSRTAAATFTMGLAFAMLLALIGIVPQSPAYAGLFGPVPANEAGDPSDTFVDSNALFAYVRSDIAGGRICVVSESGPLEALTCDRTGFGTATHLVGVGTLYTLVVKAKLTPGTWRLLVENSVGDPLETSLPFTVTSCPSCSTELADSVVTEFKAMAATNSTTFDHMCTLSGVLEQVAGRAVGLRGFTKDVKIKVPVAYINLPRGSTFVLTMEGTLFTIEDPATAGINKAIDILKDLSCQTKLMYADIAADPPDPDYAHVIDPAFSTIPAQEPASLDNLLRSVDRQRAHGIAVLRAYERYQGAVAADDLAGKRQQLLATARNAHNLSIELGTTAEALLAWADTAAADDILRQPAVVSLERDNLVAAYARVRAEGFNANETAQMHALGYSDQQVADIRTHVSQDVASLPVDEPYPATLRELATQLLAAVDTADQFAREAAAIAGRLDRPPVASFDASVDGLAVGLASTATSPDGDEITQTTWDFGDGETATGASATHAYASAGSYHVTQTVCDISACDSTAKDLRVGVIGQPPSASFTVDEPRREG